MAEIRAKKQLGQHFLRDLSAAQRTAEALTLAECSQALEIGPGTGVLTQYLLQRPLTLHAVELDRESIPVLQSKFPQLSARLYHADLLRWQEPIELTEAPFALIGNYPYNISTQILFWMLDRRERIPEMVGMFQREVAVRICSGPGSKEYGITSVLAQAYYRCEYLFTLPEGAFDPPPKVKSAVIRLERLAEAPAVPYRDLAIVVKTAFGQRRKTLRNALKSLTFSAPSALESVASLRAEQLRVDQFIALAEALRHDTHDDPRTSR